MKIKPQYITTTVLLIACIALGLFIYSSVVRYMNENAILKRIIARLEADTRVAEVLVTGVNYNEEEKKTYTTIKFLEYDSEGKPMAPRYFDFSGNIIQFQSLVVRFDDAHVRAGDAAKGKSAYLFWKVFMLDGEKTQEYEISPLGAIPGGYKLKDNTNPAEAKFWAKFWDYALDPKKAKAGGIKNAQIEAPGTMFVPGHVYTVKIEHDGGLRIDATPIAPILQGETIPL